MLENIEHSTKRKLRILTLPTGRDGCSWYRVKQPYKAIGEADLAEVVIVEPGDKNLLKLIENTDIVIARPNHEDLVFSIKALGYSDLKIIYDIDDDIWDVNPFSPVYKEIGTQEVKWDGKWLWKNGSNGFDYMANRRKLQKIESAIRQADIITCTTPDLAVKLKGKFPDSKVAVVPNAIDFNLWQRAVLPKEELRIGWTGGASHLIDWDTIADKLDDVLSENKQAKLVMAGAEWRHTIPNIIARGQYEFHKWVDITAHSYKSALLNLDIGIIPLKDIPFNHSKSCIKWYELSSLFIPCLVADVKPYNTEIIHGKTGLLYGNDKEFMEGLKRLMTDAKLRVELAYNANDWVKQNRNLNEVKNLYFQVFEKIY